MRKCHLTGPFFKYEVNNSLSGWTQKVFKILFLNSPPPEQLNIIIKYIAAAGHVQALVYASPLRYCVYKCFTNLYI